MKILFITAGLEVGKDGVADYTWLLAKECCQQGHTCSILSWNDSFLEETEEVRQVKREGIDILRMAAILPLPRKKSTARSFVETHRPDWVSVQMVNFGFHPRGFVFGLGASLKNAYLPPPKCRSCFMSFG